MPTLTLIPELGTLNSLKLVWVYMQKQVSEQGKM